MLTDLSTSSWFRRLLVAILLTGILLLTYVILQPFLIPVIWAAILAYVSWPLHVRLLKLTRRRASIAALLTTLLLAVTIILPVLWLILLMQIETVVAYREVQVFLASNPALPQGLRDLPWVGPWLQQMLAELVADPASLRQQLGVLFERSSGEISVLIGGAGRNIAKLFFALLTLFFLLRDGRQFFEQLRTVLEGILGPQVRDYLRSVGQTTRAVVYAIVLAALVQGVFAGFGYWIVGVGPPVLLGAVTAMIALIPFGAPLVWGTLTVWLLLTGKIADGVTLLLWGLLVVSWVDNIVRPLVISNATRMPFLLVVFGVLGGVLAFGLVGLFIGPVVLAVALALWREWQEHRPGAKLS
jgi:predicted PurR-regulated permease PerM